MIIQRLPYIIFRDYPNHGYLTDNRNFGYDTKSKSCRKVGDLVMSKEGGIFYSLLTENPQTLDEIVEHLCSIFEDTPQKIIYDDAKRFFQQLNDKGFVFCSANNNEIYPTYFSYKNNIITELPSLPELDFEYNTVFGQENRLSRIHLDISSRCNENCVHCYIPSKYKCSIMDEHLFDDILKQCIEMRVLNITISGGEPMMNPQIISILKKCCKNNFSVNILTNLTLMTDEIMNAISSSPLISVQTSLYSMDETVHDLITRKKGSFKKTFSAISKLWDKNVPMQINCPIMKQNYESYKDVLDWASSMNIEASSDYTLFGSYDCSQSNLYCRLNDKEIKKIIISSKTDIDKDPNQSTKLKHNNEDDYFCPVCKNSLCISNTGYIYPCEGWQGLKLGNLKNHTLKDIWNNNPTVIHLRNLRNKDFPKCLVCQNRRYCSPCLIMNANEDINGDYMKINHYMCNLARIKGQCLNS